MQVNREREREERERERERERREREAIHFLPRVLVLERLCHRYS